MLGSLRIAQIGLQAQKAQLDAVAQNLSNANTPAYKRISVDFARLLAPVADAAAASGDPSGASDATPPYRIDLTTGQLQGTGDPMDVAIAGDGFLEVSMADGRSALWRGGRLRILADGVLGNDAGLPLKADVRVPAGTTALSIAADGTVSGTLSGENKPTELGHLELVAVTGASALRYLGQGLFANSSEDGPVLRGRPGEEGLGTIAAGKLEYANVQLVDETVSMMLAQRVYEFNAKVAQAADEIMSLTNNLRK